MQREKCKMNWKKRFLFILAIFFSCIFGIMCSADVNAVSKKKQASIRVNIEKDVDNKNRILTLSLKNQKKGYYIRYTANGKKPKASSKKYKKPLIIKRTKVIKAQIFKGNKKISEVKNIKINVNKRIQAKIVKKDNWPTSQYTWTMMQYKDWSGSQAMFYTLKSSNGILIVIDGGWKRNAEYVRQVIKENGGVVHAWFLTHPHPDHIGAFNKIYADPQGIVIQTIYDTPLNIDYYDTVDKDYDEIDVYREYLQLISGDRRVKHLQSEDQLVFDTMHVDVLHAYEDNLKYMTSDICNDSGLVLKFTGRKDTVLFCADNRSKPIEDYLMKKWGTQLKSKFVQTGHHGNNSFSDQFYEWVDPEIALFDAPQWLLEGDNYTTKDLLAYFHMRGIKTYDYLTTPNVFILE